MSELQISTFNRYVTITMNNGQLFF